MMGGSPDQDSYSETRMSHQDMKLQDLPKLKDEGKDEDSEEEEFTFMCGGENIPSAVAAEDAFINGQIRPVFPLFNRELFFTPDELDSLYGNLPIKPPVDKIFVETKDSRQVTSSAARNDYINCRKAVEVSQRRPEVCKKSNSTGFSKLWRFKDFLGRSNSDGRDAFVFLHNCHAPPSTADSPASKEEKQKKANVNGKVKKGKTTPFSAHEAYLRSKAKEEEKRRSYLPYRPELMGFFTNVNGGLSKNIHPY